MKTIAKRTLLAIVGLSLAFAACSKKDDKAAADKAPAVESKAKGTASPNAKGADIPVAPHFAGGMMASYEACRALLASDTAEGVSACAKGIVQASKSSHAAAPEAVHEHIAALVAAAEALSALPADDIEALRMSFGKVSESVVAMLGAAPEIAKGYHIFECPMAKGYQRWAQPDAELANPYMGSGMLTCGSEINE